MKPHFVCIGGAAVDRKFRLAGEPRRGTSNPAIVAATFGGVARNVCENLARLGNVVSLVSAVGDDADGRALLEDLALVGVDVAHVRVQAATPTAQYVAILSPDGGLDMAVVDMAVLDSAYADLSRQLPILPSAGGWLFADCNAPQEGLARVIDLARDSGFPLAIDTISVAKAKRLPADLTGIDCLFLNRDQALSILAEAAERMPPADLARRLLDRGPTRVVLTLGAEGVIAGDDGGVIALPAQPAKVADVTGAGDSMIAGSLHGLGRGWSLPQAVTFGAHLAARTVATSRTVDDTLSPQVAAQWIEKLQS